MQIVLRSGAFLVEDMAGAETVRKRSSRKRRATSWLSPVAIRCAMHQPLAGVALKPP